MRYTTHAMLGMMLAMVLGTSGIAEETKAPWWKLGMGKAEPQSAPAFSPAPTLTPSIPPAAVAAAPASEESWLAWPSMPKMGWPDFGTKEQTVATDAVPSVAATPQRQRQSQFGKPGQQARPRNTWAQQPASATTEAAGASPWKSMTDGTRTAWHKTVDFVTPGDSADAPVVRNEPKESWWARMWGPEEQQEGPQTVTEWMAQDRLDP